MENQTQLLIPRQLNQLPTVLKSLVPVENETTQLITYTLIAAAVVGIFIYHYLKNQEAND